MTKNEPTTAASKPPRNRYFVTTVHAHKHEVHAHGVTFEGGAAIFHGEGGVVAAYGPGFWKEVDSYDKRSGQ